MAVSNVDELPILLAAGAIAMLLVNPIYSWMASKSNLNKIILFCYSFLIMNLILFIFSWKFLGLGGSLWLGRIFYVGATYILFLLFQYSGC